MLKNALNLVGWAIIVTSIIADIISFSGVLSVIEHIEGELVRDFWEIFTSFLTGVFQGIGLGLLCLYAAYQLSDDNTAKEVFD
jgi:uncharacterized membrane-anchored protein YitT (DUF2179 family)